MGIRWVVGAGDEGKGGDEKGRREGGDKGRDEREGRRMSCSTKLF